MERLCSRGAIFLHWSNEHEDRRTGKPHLASSYNSPQTCRVFIVSTTEASISISRRPSNDGMPLLSTVSSSCMRAFCRHRHHHRHLHLQVRHQIHLQQYLQVRHRQRHRVHHLLQCPFHHLRPP